MFTMTKDFVLTKDGILEYIENLDWKKSSNRAYRIKCAMSSVLEYEFEEFEYVKDDIQTIQTMVKKIAGQKTSKTGMEMITREVIKAMKYSEGNNVLEQIFKMSQGYELHYDSFKGFFDAVLVSDLSYFHDKETGQLISVFNPILEKISNNKIAGSKAICSELLKEIEDTKNGVSRPKKGAEVNGKKKRPRIVKYVKNQN